MIIPSRYNIISKVTGSPNYFIVNLLSGNADLMTPSQASELIHLSPLSRKQDFIEKGYLVEEAEEDRIYQLKYLDFLKRRDQDEIQIFFVPRYNCNFSCAYCYQAEYTPPAGQLRDETVDAFYRYISTRFAGRRKYITIFGGEPLMKGNKAESELQLLLDGANRHHLEVAIVTNGYHLLDYLDMLSRSSIREIQVTLDGTESVHNRRRFLTGGVPTFQRIVDGIDAALAKRMPINLRVVVDRENISNLPELARFAGSRGWTADPIFKTQLGRNYELHTCSLDNHQIFSRIGLYEALYPLILDNPEILEFHKPAYSIARFLFENGELPPPLFDSCPGTKTEWAFDYTGNIYSCTATVGKEGESLGTFFPQITLKEDIVEQWEDRDVVSIPQCKGCACQLACGGGCAAVAKNQNGLIQAPDCRPITSLLEMGIALYFKDEINSLNEQEEENHHV